jgi:hypothetical protein
MIAGSLILAALVALTIWDTTEASENPSRLRRSEFVPPNGRDDPDGEERGR